MTMNATALMKLLRLRPLVCVGVAAACLGHLAAQTPPPPSVVRDPSQFQGPTPRPELAAVSTSVLYKELVNRARQSLALPRDEQLALKPLRVDPSPLVAHSFKFRDKVASVFDDAAELMPVPNQSKSGEKRAKKPGGFSPPTMKKGSGVTEGEKKAVTPGATVPLQEKIPGDVALAKVLDSDTLTAELMARSKIRRMAVYGWDHRVDMWEVRKNLETANAAGDLNPSEVSYLKNAQAVGIIVDMHLDQIRPISSSDGDFYSTGEKYGQAKILCDDEKFRDELCLATAGIGTAFLVAGQRMMTACHCVDGREASNLRVIFDYTLDESTVPVVLKFKKENVFEIQPVDDKHKNATQDWAIIELKRPTTRTPVELGPGSPAVGTAVYALGYPCALPLKLSPGAEVKLLDDPERQKEMRRFHWFIANVDAYGGSSGSPVFNTKTHKVEGLLTGGFTTSDFAIIPVGVNCNKSTIINDQHMGEAICDISVVGVAP